ncbi:MAG: malonyl-[acyl-carrier protein] O-methyltransferase BioC [Gammaproteobacteria bacterium]|nr:MAG: malonyl-[acyl-carrier protein] O-methyltransferase BioC [Gammaproteobacteria bacterium]
MSNFENTAKIAKSFGAASNSYDVSARLQRFSGKYLMPWLPNRNDLTVVDLGCGTGFFTDILAYKYPQVIGLDISTRMLAFAKENRSSDIHYIEADANCLPLKDNSIDLIYSNLMIQWCDPLEKTLNEIIRVLRPGGVFLFSTLTDGTLLELKSSWAQVDDDQHVIKFKTASELEALFNNEFSTLIEQINKQIILEYEDVLHLARELKGLGANQVRTRANKGLSGKEKWQKMSKAYQNFQEPNGIYPATYNVFSGLMVKLNP